MRVKVNRRDARFLDALAAIYESPEERKNRVTKLFYFIRTDPRVDVKFSPGGMDALAKQIKETGQTAIPFKALKRALNKREDSEVVEFISDSSRLAKIGAIDLEFDKDIVLRVLSCGSKTNHIFVLMIGGKEIYLVRHIGEAAPNSEAEAFWRHLNRCRGTQAELARYPNYIIEEYCGIDLLELFGICKGDTPKENRIRRIAKRHLPAQDLFNIAYSKGTRELVVIDAV